MGSRQALQVFGAVRGAPRLAHERVGSPGLREARPSTGKILARPRAPLAFRASPGKSLPLVFPSRAPQIFVHEGARQALERKLMAAFPGLVVLSITDNRHSIISHSASRGVLRARIHHMFLDAPQIIIDSLVAYITRGDKAASARIGQYIEINGDRLLRQTRRSALHTKGKHHDLLGIFNDLNARYFDGAANPLITWGKRGRKGAGARTTIKLGSYSAVERLIRIHPTLDRAWVPRYFVAFILYHEILHHLMPASTTSFVVSRRCIHPPEFRDREQEFSYFERALGWEKRHIGRLLRS
jgi:hypothetical protein